MSRLSTPFVSVPRPFARSLSEGRATVRANVVRIGLLDLSRQSRSSHDHAIDLPLEASAQAKMSPFSTEPTMYDAAVPFTRVG